MTDVIETAKILSALPVQIVKLHSLYIPKGSKMYEEYKRRKNKLFVIQKNIWTDW